MTPSPWRLRDRFAVFAGSFLATGSAISALNIFAFGAFDPKFGPLGQLQLEIGLFAGLSLIAAFEHLIVLVIAARAGRDNGDWRESGLAAALVPIATGILFAANGFPGVDRAIEDWIRATLLVWLLLGSFVTSSFVVEFESRVLRTNFNEH